MYKQIRLDDLTGSPLHPADRGSYRRSEPIERGERERNKEKKTNTLGRQFVYRGGLPRLVTKPASKPSYLALALLG